MRPPVLRLHTDDLVVDNFAGGGGASLGIELALGRSPDIAVNHDPEAVAMHAANHPETRHFCESVWTVDPKKVCGGRPVALAWFSPDCTFHSKARGGKPFRDRNAAKRRRGLAWVVTRWARAVKPRVIFLENVEEFQGWGPLLDDGLPDPLRRGFTFRRWVAQLRGCGYEVESRELRACDFGAPTTRKRLFIIARCDGLPIVWPTPTHGPGRPLPYRTAAECITWSLPCPSIFERKRPLAENTLRRIARGLRRYVIEAPEPFIIPVTHQGDTRSHPVTEPMRTVTGAHRGEHALVAPSLIQTGWGERKGQAPRALDLHKPIGTMMAEGVKHALVAAFLARHYGGGAGHENDGRAMSEPAGTITTRDHHAVVSVSLSDGCRAGPAPTGRARGAAGRDDLEAAQPQPDEVRRAAPGRDAVEERLPAREGARGRGAVSRRSSSRGLDGAARPDPRRDGAEPRRWGQDEQLSLESRARESWGQPPARVGDGAAAALDDAAGRGNGSSDAARAGALVLADRVEAGGLPDDGVPGHAGEVAAFLSSYYGEGVGQALSAPLRTVTTRDRFALITVRGQRFIIADIGMRMLVARELYRAQGFPDSYRIDVEVNGKPLTQEAQVRMCGNAVSPVMAAALVRANVVEQAAPARAAGAEGRA